MPTTCGFPNCKFRSRYRGQEDNRHFYRIPKRPPQLRQRWLNAIGRDEENVVSQLRICSAHFTDGEKKEGDIPVPDPQLDPPVFISLPPRDHSRNGANGERRRILHQRSSIKKMNGMVGVRKNKMLNKFPISLLPSQASTSTRKHRNSKLLRLLNNGGSSNGIQTPSSSLYSPSKEPTAYASVGTPYSVSTSPTIARSGIARSTPSHPVTSDSQRHLGVINRPLLSSFPSFFTLFGMSKNLANTSSYHHHHNPRPLVALLDGRDCSIEMPLLKDVATVAFCDAQSTADIHEKVLNEAVAALLYHSITLSKEDLLKFKALKIVVRIGSGVHNVDVEAATELGIAICNTPGECVEETADSTFSLILNMYRKTFWIAKAIQAGKQVHNVEQLRELVVGSTRIRGSTLGLVGLGRVGTAVACRAKAFGFNVLFYDPNLASGQERALGIERADSLNEVLNRADCLSLHCPLTPDTRYLISVESVQKMKPGAFLVNTSASGLVQGSALLAALKAGHLKGAALDVYERDTQDGVTAEILAQLPNVIVTPNCGWYSDESSKELRNAAAKEIRRALMGRIPEDLQGCMNKEALLAARIHQDSKSTNNSHHSSTFSRQNGIPTTGGMSKLFHPGSIMGASAPHHPNQQQHHHTQQQLSMDQMSNLAALAAASGMSAESLSALGDNANNSGNAGLQALSYPNFLMSLNPQMLLNSTLSGLHHQQQQPNFHLPTTTTSNNSSPTSIYDYATMAAAAAASSSGLLNAGIPTPPNKSSTEMAGSRRNTPSTPNLPSSETGATPSKQPRNIGKASVSVKQEERDDETTAIASSTPTKDEAPVNTDAIPQDGKITPSNGKSPNEGKLEIDEEKEPVSQKDAEIVEPTIEGGKKLENEEDSNML